jgi:four helix bundle protein
MIARHYKDLVCWQLANEVKKKVFAITARPNVARDFKFCDQIRDSARSAPRNISEGFGRYRPAEFARFLEWARGSLEETHNHINDGLESGYIREDECKSLFRLIDRAAKATVKLILYLKGPGRNH